MDIGPQIAVMVLSIGVVVAALKYTWHVLSCKHDWKDIAEHKINMQADGRFQGITYIQKCEKCKDIRKFEIY
jgi:hypothetical protein